MWRITINRVNSWNREARCHATGPLDFQLVPMQFEDVLKPGNPQSRQMEHSALLLQKHAWYQRIGSHTLFNHHRPKRVGLSSSEFLIVSPVLYVRVGFHRNPEVFRSTTHHKLISRYWFQDMQTSEDCEYEYPDQELTYSLFTPCATIPTTITTTNTNARTFTKQG